jgi:hypothetical protein
MPAKPGKIDQPRTTLQYSTAPIRAPAEFLLGGQLTAGLTAAQAVSVIAAEMLLATADETLTAHGLPLHT